MKMTEQTAGRPAESVLIVEDNAELLEMLSLFLERWGFDVLSAGSGEEGLRLARGRKPALAFIDLNLPDMAGEAVARRIRAVSSPRLVAMSAQSELFEDLPPGLFDETLAKPFSLRSLRSKVAPFCS